MFEFRKILQDSLFGFHVHTRHRKPSINDKIPWKRISTEFKQDRLFHVLPEVHHAKEVEQTYLFCKEILNF